ncbi:electron transfer flavoprotein subunit beta/FixA family protein [Nakamurella sp. PAMC28650]|jgi:electron transfer flavoprotein beta subunit|uniref:electron transfer flavoprotein subunit beta/FixA family protein n=1 Tax=Nakamurella sp. PAMC28650 TaxID=2762325 RepID=UPI00164EB6B3|nr:electron transfer flavoprotein subunit beta/FixA family protein [Nakamurella sp. PAMC28650]QNK80794.1 electron transfer flavoprotein subunit beta/FixA family protein [Nakamurella sp. PAMC28650]
MEIAVLVKQVPDTYSERRLRESDWVLDRDASDAVIDEIDSKAVEVGLQLTEVHGGQVTVVTMGPARAAESLRKALAMGAHRAVHVLDDALAGSDALQTSAALAAALRSLQVDLVITGNEATDGRTASMPAMLAERLGMPAVTSVVKVAVEGSVLSAERVVEGGAAKVSASLPLVLSVNEKIGEPRYPNFKGIMAAKSKPVSVLSAADLGLDPGTLGLANASTQVVSGAPRPLKSAGEKVTDDGEAGNGIAEFLVAQRLV